ncbi:MAG: hypothetical protein E6700_01340 [Winkia neuii]|uniref:Uncharacterized protein n=1 Tax=Winkia neuii TaxID=33007 RepID=A0A2I1IPP7_9ACTO|nr:hypothetical protein [Winkia neuii]OFJ72116.1 hypothetical protein HMPREF2851_04060 [Actinomyces sp. HMSC064C12]OFK02137.1 hypothetical protein HMPREF2835_07300 [Actinomyces sp. HMSC072A03]OFT54218.1 hypothetical protein HMPREF3152_09420 [Actinomyces sp. HMSC06A08]KWZ74543.1 hypothetical protein HMPREF3198_00718 [Winkia neuii]MDK8098598.1 hypothetical protein [Winkia neuii]
MNSEVDQIVRFASVKSLIKDAIRSYIYWTGISFGLAAIPAQLLNLLLPPLGVIPFWGVLLTGIVLLAADPPTGWTQPLGLSYALRLLSTGIATFLNFFVVGLGNAMAIIGVGVNSELPNLLICAECWLIYAVIAGVLLYIYRSITGDYDQKICNLYKIDREMHKRKQS